MKIKNVTWPIARWSSLTKPARAVTDQKWPECTVFGHGIGDLVRKPHVRKAPHDGLLQLTGMHNYLSITQVLIRRSLFSKTGTFPNKWGPPQRL